MTACAERIKVMEPSSWKAVALVAIESICNQLKGAYEDSSKGVDAYVRLAFAGVSSTAAGAGIDITENDDAWDVEMAFYEIKAIADLVIGCDERRVVIDLASIENIIFAKAEGIKAMMNGSACAVNRSK